MREWLSGDTESTAPAGCDCSVSFESESLVVSAADCPSDGTLVDAPDCRATVIGELDATAVDAVHIHNDGIERSYLDDAVGLLVAAGRFATRVAPIDDRLAVRARRDPLAAATEATGRAGRVADLAAETGLGLFAAREGSYEELLGPYVGPTVSDVRVRRTPPSDATLQDRRTLETGAVVREYETPQREPDSYHVEPREQQFERECLSALAAAHERLVTAPLGETRAAYEAATEVCADDQRAGAVGDVLAKHTDGLGILEDLFADPRVTDVFVTAPVTENRLRVTVDGTNRRTNVRLTAAGARALASTFRRTSGRAFSQASPSLDATATVAGRQVRVTGVTEPVSDGLSFAFRAHDSETWRLSDLVANGTITSAIAGLLSIVLERGGACLVAGPRGSGKTTLLGALLWELPQTVRTLVIEDTPELPVDALQSDGRDVLGLQTSSGDGPSITASDALRTALRLGDGALVVGEVRGEEASVLYEAMRVGSGDGSVLGTIHGADSDAVRERLVTDLGVPERSFAATDVVVTLAAPTETHGHRLERVDEVVERDDGVHFESLYDYDGATAVSTSRLERGNSRLVGSLSAPGESYEAVRDEIQERTSGFDSAVESAVSGAGEVREADDVPRNGRDATSFR